jgi:hypothetical protein
MKKKKKFNNIDRRMVIIRILPRSGIKYKIGGLIDNIRSKSSPNYFLNDEFSSGKEVVSRLPSRCQCYNTVFFVTDAAAKS